MQEVVTTTLKLLREHDACADGYKTLVNFLGEDYPDDKEINLLTILESNGPVHCLWAFQATVGNHEKIARLIAADCAESVLHIYTQQYPKDKRPENAIKAVRDFANAIITENKMLYAAMAALAAAYATNAAYIDAVYVADAASYAAYAAAYASATSANSADDASVAAAYAAYAAAAAAEAAAAYHKEREKQADIIRKYLKKMKTTDEFLEELKEWLIYEKLQHEKDFKALQLYNKEFNTDEYFDLVAAKQKLNYSKKILKKIEQFQAEQKKVIHETE